MVSIVNQKVNLCNLLWAEVLPMCHLQGFAEYHEALASSKYKLEAQSKELQRYEVQHKVISFFRSNIFPDFDL